MGLIRLGGRVRRRLLGLLSMTQHFIILTMVLVLLAFQPLHTGKKDELLVLAYGNIICGSVCYEEQYQTEEMAQFLDLVAKMVC